jgi:formate hydrogenlyase subunit 3/multisubunit Na+/H+ antiporter MnhD subunit
MCLNYILHIYQSTIFFYSLNINFTTTVLTHHVFNLDSLSLNLIDVYIYPFIYIFLLITILSIIFCLSYNYDELINFMVFYQIIFLAGYLFFFTNSIIIFFLSYEMLLIPSFFILYKFAKTRRCVEAAYLMFFWTQFGALFLIFAFLYLFFICGSSLFTNVTSHYFSIFEMNFLFLCFLAGFGVKLPIWPFYG